MMEQLANPAPRPLRDLIADDSFGVAFQTMAQYRAALLKHATTHAAVSAVTNEQISAQITALMGPQVADAAK